MSECLHRSEVNNSIVTTIKRFTNIDGFEYDVYESGVRTGDKFELIQHSWVNYSKAHNIIIKLLGKNWDTYRITEVLEFIKERGFLRIKPKLFES
jgi:hypothetical protein